MRTDVLRGVAAIALWLLLGAYLIGCGTGDAGLGWTRLIQPPVPQDLGPRPDSPSGALRLLEWIHVDKSVEAYRLFLADDFRFVCGANDSSGADWRGNGSSWTREDELLFATHLFVGGGAEPPANVIQLNLDRSFFILPDPVFPWDPSGRWHKHIRSALTLAIVTADGGTTEIAGHGNFFLVRGDSAAIPEELRLRGIGPDSTRWYLRRWEDETDPSGSPVLAAQPSSAITCCRLRTLYR